MPGLKRLSKTSRSSKAASTECRRPETQGSGESAGELDKSCLGLFMKLLVCMKAHPHENVVDIDAKAFFFFLLAPFSAASLSQLRGAPGTRALQAVFSEASILTCTLFLRRAASSRAHNGYRAGSRDAPGEDGHAARRSLKSGQGPSRLLRPGEGKEVRLSAKASEAAAHNKPDHRWT